MTRRWILWSMLVASIAIACGMGFKAWFFVDPRLNVIFITLDTTRTDHLGCYGDESALTPTIDAIAHRGVVFEHAYTPVPLTLPAHASMLTGLYPFEHGLFTNHHHGLPTTIPTLAEVLAGRGYATAAFLASFVLNQRFGLDRGFETYDDDVGGLSTVESPGEGIRSADQIVDRALAWLTANNHKPFFCWLHLFDPHAKYLAHRETFGDQFESRPYDAEIAFVDVQLKRLTDFLDSRQLTDRTIIVIAGDHGEGLGEHRERWHGYFLYNSTLRVPLIISLPAKHPKRQSVPEPVSLVDIAPTLLDYLDAPALSPISGRSLRPLISGEALTARGCYGVAKEAFFEEGWAPLSCLITADWKYIQSTKPELFDLQHDPGETTNLAESRADKVQEMRLQLMELEGSGTRYDGPTISVSERERNKLAGLGYVGGGSSKNDSSTSSETRQDIKDRLDDFDAFQAALDYCIQGRSELAVAPLYQLIASAPNYLAPRQILAQLLSTQGKSEDAEAQYLAILDIAPENIEAHITLGKLLASQKQFESALEHLRKALQGAPLSSDLHLTVAKVLRELGRPREAAVHFRTAEDLSNQQQQRTKAQR